MKLVKKNCGRPGEDFSHHPYFRKQECFSFWPNLPWEGKYPNQEDDIHGQTLLES